VSGTGAADRSELERIDAGLLAVAHFFASREVRELVQGAGLPAETRALFPALRAVRDLAPPVSTKDVQQEIGLSHPATCRVIDRCVAQGFVARAVSTIDRRHTVLALTPAGQEAAGQVEAARRAVVARLVEEWSDADRVALMRCLQRLEPELARVRGGESRSAP